MDELKNKTVERFELIQMLRLRCFRQVAKENYIPCRQYPIMEYLMEHVLIQNRFAKHKCQNLVKLVKQFE